MREKLIEVLDDFPVQMEWHENEELADHLIANGVTIPVLCKECKYCVEKGKKLLCDRPLPTKRMEDYLLYGFTVMARVKADDFCSRGERRNDG